jgi:DUF1680 family protein
VRRAFTAGEVIELDLPMPPRWTYADSRVDAVRGCVAVERGPRVYCLESVDLPDGVPIDGVRVDTSRPPVADGDAVAARLVARAPSSTPWPYGMSATESASEIAFDAFLHPYHDWANRGPSAMRVWIPVTEKM